MAAKIIWFDFILYPLDSLSTKLRKVRYQFRSKYVKILIRIY